MSIRSSIRPDAPATTSGIVASVLRCRANRDLSSSRHDTTSCGGNAWQHRPGDNVAFGPGTLGLVIEKYLASADYISKAQGTQRHYRVALDQLREICGRALIADLQERHIRQIRKRFTATSKADLAVMLVRMLWVFAKEVLAMDLGPNPAAEIRKLHRQGWSHEPWPDWVIEKFEAEAQPKPNAQLALMLLHYTGQRASDVVRMRWSDYDGEGIQVRQLKTGTPLWIPCHVRAEGRAR